LGGWKHFWGALFANAKQIGLKPKNVLLLSLAAFSFVAMIAGLSPYAAIMAVIIFYCLDPVLKLAKSWVERRNKLNQRTVVETNFRTHLRLRRRELRPDEPELPLSPPSSSDRLEP
jgi:hypothetical protein